MCLLAILPSPRRVSCTLQRHGKETALLHARQTTRPPTALPTPYPQISKTMWGTKTIMILIIFPPGIITAISGWREQIHTKCREAQRKFRLQHSFWPRWRSWWACPGPSPECLSDGPFRGQQLLSVPPLVLHSWLVPGPMWQQDQGQGAWGSEGEGAIYCCLNTRKPLTFFPSHAPPSSAGDWRVQVARV